MPVERGDGFFRIILPNVNTDIDNAASVPRNFRFSKTILWFSCAQIINIQADCFRWAFIRIIEQNFSHSCDFHKSADRTAMQGRDNGIANIAGFIGQGEDEAIIRKLKLNA